MAPRPLGADIPVLHAGLQVEVGVNRAKSLDDVNTQPLEHLEDRRAELSLQVTVMAVIK